ncbi:uncharacterized protein LOC125251927 [Megalobrama amblycephala]|uniref:uncharacterized protein LOC125251927 n=1 Tax=Megalobrama amblycephala TaxID=75352 RepID=UPI002013F506|nr:uncharacterized protein LOC125251927 [Megalobrama amblycephala]
MDRCFLLIVIMGTGLVSGDNIEPDKEKNVTTKETETVKLSCSYSTTSNNVYLYWYRQYPNKEPQYLLLKGARSYSYEETSDDRFLSTTSRTSTELTITDVRLSDSALYYCALRVGAQMNLHSLILLCVSAAAVFGNTIKPDTTNVGADEGQNVKLSCSYSSPGGSDYLFWYRQYGRSKPEFLVSTLSTEKKPKVSEVHSRFSVKVEKKEQIHMDLIISSAAVSDSALYYCALRPTVTGNTVTLYKNPSVFNPMRTSNRHRDKDYKRICKPQM